MYNLYVVNTIFRGYNYGGNSVCVYPNSDHDQAPNGVSLDIGFVPQVSSRLIIFRK